MTLKVLLIDDDEDEYVLTSQYLSDIPHRKFELTWCCNYETGIQALENEKYDICLLDYRIGDRTGLDLLDATRDLKDRAPIVLVTNSGDFDVDLKGMELGASDFLEKDNLSASQLERTIRYVTDRSRTEALLRDALNGR